jgi:hypothetical protein
MGHFLPLVDFVGPATLGVMIPLIIFMIPIIAILTSHQRKMAEIIHGTGQPVDARLGHELEAMRRELSEVKMLLHQQSIAIDNLAPRLSPPSDITKRLENVAQ